jgi:hypothetical protein
MSWFSSEIQEHLPHMDSQEAIELARKVLLEERTSPTVRYMLRAPVAFAAALAAVALTERGQHPRTVRENPGFHRFTSDNYNLLSGLYSELAEADKVRFIEALSVRITDGSAYSNPVNDVRGAGEWRSCRSELPLIAEFLVRQKHADSLLAAMKKAPIRPALTLLLMQIEEMIALDFTLFADHEYEFISSVVKGFQPQIEALNGQIRTADTKESNTRFHLVRELPPLCASLIEMSRKAIFLRMKSDRSSEANTEIQADRTQVGEILKRLGFSRLLIASLEEAERSYREAATAFEYKECMAHLRSFLENLHKEACVLVHAKRGGLLPSTWGRAIGYLVQEGVITKTEEAFVTSLYTLVSDVGVHPLAAEREYARLVRNMNIEYGLLFLTRVDKWVSQP